MKCPSCKLEAVIKASRYVVENDDTPNAQTLLYSEQEIVCRNPQCKNHNKVVDIRRSPIKLG